MNICSLIRRNLYCAREMELMASMLLKHYAEGLNSSAPGMREAKVVLLFLAIESEKHAEIIDLLVKSFDLRVEVDACEHVIGEPWRVLQNLFVQISSGVSIDLNDFVEKQMWVERAVGEETYHRLLMPLISRGLRLGCLDEHSANVASTILDKLTLDEEWHEKIIKELIQTKI